MAQLLEKFSHQMFLPFLKLGALRASAAGYLAQLLLVV
jgi:hypothetical protein